MVSHRSCRQRNRPKSTGDSEENHHFIWHLGPSCVAKRSREHFKSEQSGLVWKLYELQMSDDGAPDFCAGAGGGVRGDM